MAKPTSYHPTEEVDNWVRQYAWAYNIPITLCINRAIKYWWESLDPKVQEFVLNYRGEDVDPPYVAPRHANRG